VGVYVNDEIGRLDLERALREISPERRAYANRYHNELDRRLSVAVYLLLKDGLRREYGLKGNPRLGIGPSGKPFLVEHPEIHFSFSHCPKAAACALSDRPVGVDVEVIAPVDWNVAALALSAEDLLAVRTAAESAVGFACCWTRMEAAFKLGVPAKDCVFETDVRSDRGYVLTTAARPDLV